MVNRLKKTQPKAQPASPKANMLKKFGGKFKRAFSRQNQVCYSSSAPNVTSHVPG